MRELPSIRRFFKYEGLGNDFVVVDEREAAQREPALPLSARRAICALHTGVGADGVLTVLPSRIPGAVARMHITNADGSVPEMCGNGLRCVSLFLVDAGVVVRGQVHVVDTDAGPREVTVLDDGVRIEMGPPAFDVPRQFPPMRRAPLDVDGQRPLATAVSMGNPHLVLAMEPDVAVATRIGPGLERDPRFPERINVELAAQRGPRAIDVVVWERGVGITRACGAGACAVAAAFVDAGLAPLDEEIEVRLPGGPLLVRVPRQGSIVMKGPARLVFEGRLVAAALVA